VLSHRPFARLAEVVHLAPRQSRLLDGAGKGVEGMQTVIRVPFRLLGTTEGRRRSTSAEIEFVRRLETQRGTRRAVF
jgi:hypothetical protein